MGATPAQYKIAIVGTGHVATQNYIPYLATQADVTLSYYNRTLAKAEAAARQFGGRATASLGELMADDPDAVLVLTRETQRYEVACALLELHARRLFFEKPLVARQGQAHVTEEDFTLGREILQRARAAGTETAMVFNYRFFEQTRRAQAAIAERQWGPVRNITGLVHYACWSHCLDLVTCFAGPIAEVTALRSRQGRPFSGESAVDTTVAFRTQGDATGTILGTSGLDFGLPLFELTFGLEQGRIHLRDLDGDLELLDYRGKRHEVYAISRHVSRWDHYRASFASSLEAYLGALRTGAPAPIPGLAGLQELQFEAAMQRSIAAGRPVVLAEEFPLDG